MGRRSRGLDGRAAGRLPEEFDPVDLARGTDVEMEHTRDRGIAERIAMDHMAEDPDYYEKLATIHHEGMGETPGGFTWVLIAAGILGLIWWSQRQRP